MLSYCVLMLLPLLPLPGGYLELLVP